MNDHFEVLSLLANNLPAARFTIDNTGQVSLSTIEIFGNPHVFTLSSLGFGMCFRVLLDECEVNPVESIMLLPNENVQDYAGRILNLIKDFN